MRQNHVRQRVHTLRTNMHVWVNISSHMHACTRPVVCVLGLWAVQSGGALATACARGEGYLWPRTHAHSCTCSWPRVLDTCSRPRARVQVLSSACSRPHMSSHKRTSVCINEVGFLGEIEEVRCADVDRDTCPYSVAKCFLVQIKPQVSMGSLGIPLVFK
jgi:hypothetical protein